MTGEMAVIIRYCVKTDERYFRISECSNFEFQRLQKKGKRRVGRKMVAGEKVNRITHIHA